MRHLAALAVAAALAFGAAGWTAAAAQSGDPSLALMAKKKKPARHRAPAQPEQQIACTFLGCHPVPPGCHPQIGYDWRGNPTGFDVVACPGR